MNTPSSSSPQTPQALTDLRPFKGRGGRALVLLASSAVVFAGMSACGGAAGSGVDRNKPLTKLDDGEKKKLCDAFATQVEDKLPPATVCQVTGVAAAFAVLLQGGDVKKTCTQAVEDCLAEPATTIQCDAEALKDFPSCDAKVGALEDCGTDYVNTLSAFLGQFPKCENLADFLAKATPDQIEGLSSAPESPASCKALPEDCNFPPSI